MIIKVVAYVIIVAGFLLYLLIEYRKLAESSYNFGFALIAASYKTLYLYIAVIFFSCYFIALGVKFVLRNIKPLYDAIFKSGWQKPLFRSGWHIKILKILLYIVFVPVIVVIKLNR